MPAASAPVVHLHPARRPVLLVSLNDTYVAEIQAVRLPVASFPNMVAALSELHRNPGKYAAIVLDFDQSSPQRIPGFVKELHTFEEARDLSPTPVMLIWRGANLDARLIAEQAGIIWVLPIPLTGPSLLGFTLDDFLSAAATRPVRSS